MANRDTVWLPEKQGSQSERHAYDSTGEDREVESVLAIGFVLSCRAGEVEDKRCPIKVKKHGRPAQSLFRVGLDWLVFVLFKGIRLLDLLGGEVVDLLAVKEDAG